MSRRLFNACVAAVLTLGGWAGALASVVCPHAGGGAAVAREHACCRAKVGAKRRTPARVSTPDSRQASAHHATPRGGSCHSKAPAAAVTQARAEAHHDVAPAADAPGAASGERVAARPAKACAHCVSRPELPPAPVRALDREGARLETGAANGRAPSPVLINGPPRPRAIAVARGGPPGTTRLYVLINRFLI